MRLRNATKYFNGAAYWPKFPGLSGYSSKTIRKFHFKSKLENVIRTKN